MATLKRPEWITRVHAERIIGDAYHFEHGEGIETLREALVNGGVASRKRHGFDLPYTDLIPRYWEQKLDFEEPHDTQFEIRLTDVLNLINETSSKTGAPRGRPPKHDWDDFWIKAVLLANTPDGLPETQAEFERYMAARYDEYDLNGPGESQIREKAGKLYRARAGK